MDIAITGHRPKDLGTYNRPEIRELANDLIDRAVTRFTTEVLASEDPNAAYWNLTFHTGGALGVDQWVGQTIDDYMTQWADNETMHHVLHLPFIEDVMTKPWAEADQRALHTLVARHTHEMSDDCGFHFCGHCPQPDYHPSSYQLRNMHMVDLADMVIAFWNGKTTGGTWNAITYAEDSRKPVYNALDGFKRIR